MVGFKEHFGWSNHKQAVLSAHVNPGCAENDPVAQKEHTEVSHARCLSTAHYHQKTIFNVLYRQIQTGGVGSLFSLIMFFEEGSFVLLMGEGVVFCRWRRIGLLRGSVLFGHWEGLILLREEEVRGCFILSTWEGMEGRVKFYFDNERGLCFVEGGEVLLFCE